ncbi:protein Hook homolog 1-like isoform X5 [Dermacentor silvarum]|uniref:protein Hook homolog 1-like isoform X5 n=1 Tax=Dermacentor silvarum TaxID=543639 RepID=UPI0021011B2B|nr:protein Hook homolog 1-like isoform X5 [Dermacentor silvarum]
MLHGHLTETAVCVAAIVVVLAVLALLVLMLGRRRKSYSKLLADAGWRSADEDQDLDQSGQNQNRKRGGEKAKSHNTSGEHGEESTSLSHSSMASGVITTTVATSAMDASTMQDCDKAESQKNGDLQEHRLTEAHGVELTTCLTEQGRCLANLEQLCEEEVHHMEELHLTLAKATNNHKQLVRRFEHESRAHTERAAEAINKRLEEMRQALEKEQAQNNDLHEKLREAEWAVTAKVTELKETHRIELEAHERKHRQSIEVLDRECRTQTERAEDFEKRLKQSDLFHAEELRQVLRECAEAAEAMKRKLTQDHAAEVAALRDQLDDQRKESDAIVSEKSEALETLKLKMEELSQLEEERVEHHRRVESLEQQCKEWAATVKDLQKRLDNGTRERQKEAAEVSSKWRGREEALLQLIEEHEATITALQEEVQNKRSTKDAVHRKMSQEVEAMRTQMTAMSKGHEVELEREKAEYQKQLQVVNNLRQDAVQLPQQRQPQAVQLRMQSTISTEVSYSLRRPVQRES